MEKKFVNIALGVVLAAGIVAGAIGPCWVALISIIITTAAALALLEVNGNNVTTY